jgi:hypothetical protein
MNRLRATTVCVESLQKEDAFQWGYIYSKEQSQPKQHAFSAPDQALQERLSKVTCT